MQRRNRGNELIVAIAVVGTLTVALTFAIILTLTGSKDTPSDSSQTRTVAALLPDTITPTLPLPSDTPTLTLTTTPTPTSTLVPTATVTLIPSITPRPSITPTGAPSVTATLTPLLLPSDTPTLTLTITPSHTFTPSITPSRTPSLTPNQTFTPSRTPSPTPIPPTLTFTPYPSLTPSITPFGGDRTSTPSGSGCVVPADWLAYTVQPGDTLFRLGGRFNVAWQELAAANCISDPYRITAGQILYAPPGSDVTPPAPAAPAGVVGGMTRFDCDNPAATITQPVPGTVLRGAFALYGTATHPDFQFYRLQISGSGTNDADFATLMVYPGQVINGQLGTVNTAAFAPGAYWLRLTVVDNTGNYVPQCTVQVRFES